MMIIRPYSEADKEALAQMHKAQGFEYTAPEWSNMLISGVVEVDGKVEMAAFLRKTSEAYLLLDPNLEISKRGRIGQFFALNREVMLAAKRVGFSDMHCWLPPQLDKDFGRFLMHLGWQRPLWPCYSRNLE